MRVDTVITKPKNLPGLSLDTENIPVEMANVELTSFGNNPNIHYRGHSRLPDELATPRSLETLLAEGGCRAC